MRKARVLGMKDVLMLVISALAGFADLTDSQHLGKEGMLPPYLARCTTIPTGSKKLNGKLTRQREITLCKHCHLMRHNC